MGPTEEVGGRHTPFSGQLDVGQAEVAVAEGNEEGSCGFAAE